MYKDIFEEILMITHNDYAGYLDKEGWDRPKLYLEKLESLVNDKKINEELFSKIVNDYLLDFADNHIYFTVNQKYLLTKKTCGFSVKWFADSLYVTEVSKEERLSIGDKITMIDNIPVKDISITEQKVLRESIPERQHWHAVLSNASSIEYINEKNQKNNLDIRQYDINYSKSTFENKAINESTYYLKLPNLVERDKIATSINSYISESQRYSNLIVDLRDNSGGDGSNLVLLEPFMFAYGEKPYEVIPARLFNSTERNVDLFIELCDMYRHIELDSNTRNMLNYGESEFKKNRGKGFIEMDFSQIFEAVNKEFEGTSQPEKVVILMNEGTASAAESFIESSSESSKVTTIGRATMGVNDYSDLVIQKWGSTYELFYPISKAKTKTTHHPIFGLGIHPDVHVRWTPESINVDKELEQAIKLLSSKN